MKLHLPTALRRALLAITALLSPAVVTTTLATATLAAISAPAMAADLSLTGSHKLSSNQSYDSVYTNASSVTLKASGDKLDNRKLTTGTLTVNYGDTLNLTTDEMVTFYLNVGRLTVGENATININTGDKGSIYASAIEAGTATGTLYDLLSGVRNAGIVIEKAHTIYFEGAGSDNLTTSFITSKIGGTPAYNGICGIEVTEGHLTVDSSLAKSGNLSYQLRIGSEAAATTTITKDVNHLESAFFVGSAYHTECTTVSIEYSANALTLEDIYLYASSKIVSDRDLIFQNESTVYLCGELTVNGKTTFAGDTYITNTNYSTACTMSTNGSTAVNSGVTVDIQTGTKWNIGGIIENNGTLNFNGSCTMNIASSGFEAKYSYTHPNNNGYKRESIYTVLTGTGTITGITNCTWQVDSATASYANGKVTVSGRDNSVFYVKNGVVKYGTVVEPLASLSTKFSLEGGRLELGMNLVDRQGIVAKTAGSSVKILSGTELKSNQVTVEGSGSVVLSGGGSYTMANGANTLGDGVSLGDGWSGTVNTTGNTSALALDTLGVSGSTVALGSNSHTLEARNQSVAANITSTGSISLTGNKLTLSGTNELGSLNVGSLEIAGGSTTITDGLTTGRESSVATGATLNIKGNSTLGGKITNNGTLNLSGTINVDSTALTAETSERYSGEDNGYKTVDTTYTVLTGNAATGTATWKVGTDSATYEDGKVIVAGIEDKSVYYVRNNIVNYGTVVTVLATEDTKFSLEGGSLELGKELVDDQGIVAKTADSSVTILSGTELKSNQVTVEGSGSVVLSGGGSYTMANGANTLGDGVSLSDDWRGTVNTIGDTTALELNTLGVSGSNVVLGSNNHTLAARNQSVAANITSTGSISLTGYKLTLNGTNKLGSVSVGSLGITGGSTAISNGLTTDSISGTVSVTGGTLQEMTAGSAISTSGSVSLSNVTLGAVLNNNGTLNLSGTINVDSTAFTAGTRERYSDEDNGYKTVDTTYTVLTGNAATGTATWKVGTDSATYKNGLVIVAGIENKSVYYVKNGVVKYDTGAENLKTLSTKFSLEGGSLELGKELVDDQGIVAKTADSRVTIQSGTELKSNQVTVEGSGSVVLSGDGAYEITGTELSLGSGVSVGSDWSGTVKTVGDTTVSSNLDTTSWKNTELNGTTTVNSGVTLTLGGNTTLKGKITNNGTLNLGDNITIDYSSFAAARAVTTINPHYQQGSSAESMTSGFISSSDGMTIQVVEGNAANDTGANWSVTGVTDASYTFDATSGELHVLEYKSRVGTEFYINDEDTITYDQNDAIFKNINGKDATGLVLNGGNLVLSTNLLNDTREITAKKAGTVEIGEGVHLNASQLDVSQLIASTDTVTLTGKGTYILADENSTLGANVKLGSDWSGTLQTSGDTTNMDLGQLAQGSSSLELGSNNHTLAAQNQSVAANLNSTGSISLTGYKLTLSGTNNKLGSLNVGSLEIVGGSTTVDNGLTTGGDSSVATGATLNINGTSTLGGKITNNGTLNLSDNSTLGGKITNSGTLNLGGNITIDYSKFEAARDVTIIDPHYQQGSSAESMTSGFMSSDGMTIQVVEGNAANATGANWSVTGVTDGSYTFDATSGELHVVSNGRVGTEFYINDDITYVKEGSGSEIFTNINGYRASKLVLNGGDLKLSTELHEETAQIRAQQAGTVEISNGVTLNASQLDASQLITSDDAVKLSGKGTYTMVAGANTLGEGVSLGSGWAGRVELTGGASALDISSLGVSGSVIRFSGTEVYTLTEGDHTVDATVEGGDSVLKMNGGALALNKTTTLKGVYGANAISAANATFSDGLTTDSISGTVSVTGGTLQEAGAGSAISTSGTVALSDVTLGAVLNNSGTLSFHGDMVLNTNLLGNPTDTENWYSDSNDTDQSVGGWYGSTSGSGFRTIQDIYTVVTGQDADNQATTWKVDTRKAEYDSGKVLAFRDKDLTTYWVNTNSEISLDTADDEFTAATATIALNGGKLEMDTNTELDLESHAVSTVVISNDVTLNASKLNASAADVTLSGEGSYDLQGQELSGTLQLGAGVSLDKNAWKGTVYTGGVAQGAALDITALGKSQSTVHLGVRPMLRSTPSETELESLTAAGVGTTVIPGSLTLLKDTSTADTLVVNGTLTLGSPNTAASLEADTVSLQRLNFAHADSSLKADKLNLEGSTTLNVQLTDEVLSNKDAGKTLTLLTLANGFDGTLTFNDDTETERVRSGDNRKEYTLAWDKTGTVLTLTILGTETYVTEQVAPTTGNGSAAVALMTEVFLNSRPQKEAPEGALAGILNAVDAGAATDRDMAAVAGASTAALGMALSGDVERQLSAIRNRSVAGNDAATVTLASGKSGMLAAAPARFFAWVNAEGNRAEQDADSTAAGYTLTSWGGTLGAGMQVNDKLTLGLALTAMYGDLQSDGPDSLKGDMDTTYVSAFARYNKGKWSHAFIGTVGSMEADYKRSAMSYSTAGDTDGTALGLMYEVSRGVQLSNRSTLSPVFNISYRHTEVDSYSESGADAALNVGKQSLDTVTAGAGARYAAVVGQRMLNRACGFEARALVKYDLGDRQSTTSTGFINRATRAGIESAELGAFGVELGAGISVPVRTGSIFADAAVELRSDYTNMNGTVGYRVQF